MMGRSMGGISNRAVHETGFLIQALLMGNMLKDDKDLRHVLARSLRMALPATLAGPICQVVESVELMRLPSPAALSRWRFLLDAAFMLHQRDLLASQPRCRYCQIDSSTQGGKDYELIVTTTISKSVLQDAFRKANSLIVCRLG